MASGCLTTAGNPNAGGTFHDLSVSNNWHQSITLQVSTGDEERKTLGDISPGDTITFHEAVPDDAPRYTLHARYDNNQFEFLTLCLTKESLEQLAWQVTIPGTGNTCTPSGEPPPP